MSNVETAEYELILAIAEHLHGALDLKRSINSVAPLLQRLVGADHVAIAVSRPGGMYDYEWYNSTLPDAFFGNYAVIAARDFVRDAVSAAPNRVLIDQQMITRKEYDRHIVNQHARATGANLQRVMAVMLCHEQQWSSGLSLYRDRETPFTERDAMLLQRVVPLITSAVRNSREHAALQRDVWLEPVIAHAGLAAVWIRRSGHEVTRTACTTALLERYFRAHERLNGSLPEVLRDYALRCIAAGSLGVCAEPFLREGILNCLRATVVALPSTSMWAIVLQSGGLDEHLAGKLSPRQATIAGSMLRGLSNREIADKEELALATVKDHAEEVYRRLGVKGRKGLIQLASGLGGHESDVE